MNQSDDNTIINIINVSHTYDGEKTSVDALDNIDLEIKKGEFMCVLGPSGCGKSTLLKLIAGFEKPTSGQILLRGEPVSGPDWHRGVVFQMPTLYPWLNVYRNVEYGLKMRGVEEKERAQTVNEYLELVGLSDFKQSKTYELSGGMRQRVAMARVLVNHPDIILMDEPFGALDALTRQNMQGVIKDIWKKTNSTIFLITHDVDEALILGTSVVVMTASPGRVAKQIATDYWDSCDREGDSKVRYSGEYGRIREELLNLIMKV